MRMVIIISILNGFQSSGLVTSVMPVSVYSGKEIVLNDLVFTDLNMGIKIESDYIVTYKDLDGEEISPPINVGEYVLSITRTNHRDINAHFIIRPQSLANVTLGAIPTATYDGTEKTIEIPLFYNNQKLIENTDYTTIYSNNIEIGKASIEVIGVGNFKEVINIEFDIVAPESINQVVIEDIPDMEYFGNPVQPSIIAKNSYTGEILVEYNHYNASYRDNNAVGVGYAIFNGIGSYSGTIEKAFNIYVSYYYCTGLIKNTSGIGLANKTVQLIGTNILGEEISKTATTNSDGRYYFLNILYGTYSITYNSNSVDAKLNPMSEYSGE